MSLIGWESLDPDQRVVADSDLDALLVLGGAGVGKTTTALWAARRHLTDHGRLTRAPADRRVLFATFSRTAVAQIRSRMPGVLEGLGDCVEVITFHGLAFRLARAFGAYAGIGNSPSIAGEARSKLGVSSPGQQLLGYGDLIPLALRLLETPGPIADLVRERWSMVICDEFQDTDDDEWKLLRLVGAGARLLLLADPNQMIYGGFKPGVSEARLDDAVREVGAERLVLPARSYRDPSQVLPHAAEEIRRRRFDAEPVARAVADGRIRVLAGTPDDPQGRANVVADQVRLLRSEGHGTLGVYAKTNLDAATLSAYLSAAGVTHVPIGFGEAFGECLNAMFTMTSFALGECSWEEVPAALAIALTATVRSPQAPPLANALLAGASVSPAFDERLLTLRDALAQAGSLEVGAEVSAGAWEAIGFDSGRRSWTRAQARFLPLAMQAGSDEHDPLTQLGRAVLQSRDASFVELDAGDSGSIQLMNFSQTKGREADAVILSYTSSDWYGRHAAEPFDEASRILYVSLTRAKGCAVVLLPSSPHPLVAPFLGYA